MLWILLSLLLLVSCAPQPEVPDVMPSVTELTCSVDGNTAILSARLSGNASGVTECGFMYGLSEDDMLQEDAVLEYGSFSVTVSGLEYDSEYTYAAFFR